MPPFWDPICPPQGIVCLKSFLENRGYDVHIADFNTDAYLFGLQRRYFEEGMSYFPNWRFLNIYRNGPRYFARHQLAFLCADKKRGAAYRKLVGLILNFDGKNICTEREIESLDAVINESFNLVASKTKELIYQIEPDLVGCTMLESTFPLSLAILKKTKEIDHKIKTVLGGPGAIMGNTADDGNLQEIIKKCDWIDAIIYGEGEQLLEKYLEGFLGDKKIITVHDLKSSISPQERSDLSLDVNVIPMPNYDGLQLEGYLWLSIFTSRGCPYKCAFCFENCYWMRFRKKRLKKIVNEMKVLSARYGKDKFYICDSITNHIASQLSKALLSEGEKYRWDCYMRVTSDCLDKEKVRLWATGGLERVRIGVESASPHVLKMMNKNIPLEYTKNSLINFARNGINTTTLWIAGFPGEREEDFQESINFLDENSHFIFQADVWEFICSPKEISFSGTMERDFSTRPVYPEEFDDLLLVKYYDLKNGPSSQERFERISRFEKTRMRLEIPNPYSIRELMEAQVRWIKLGYQKDEAHFFKNAI